MQQEKGYDALQSVIRGLALFLVSLRTEALEVTR